MVPRTVQDILDHGDELAKRFARQRYGASVKT